jgi:Concanavalin A-like lectin/glucanases superfamily
MGTSAGPDIVEDGLVLHLDAGSKRSYPGTGTTWTDLSGQGNVGTFVNNTVFNSANLGSVSFDGSGDYVDIPNNSSFSFGTGDFTVEAWVYIAGNSPLSNDSQRNATIATNLNGSSRSGWLFYIGGDSSTTGISFAFQNRINSSQYNGFGAGVAIEQNRWHNLIASRQGTLTKLFFNGELVASGTLLYQNITSANPLTIGQMNWSGYSYDLNGRVSNLKIYNRALTENEVKQNYNALRGRYSI